MAIDEVTINAKCGIIIKLVMKQTGIIEVKK
ncbi:hypothetical protein J2S77_002311 [Alkalibacillus salilacus]|uniref:Uncharacterized protein n=1 Tax=Alkalibacillus salilacus TaxID=284582 RepID=A0ABT9VH70_9BACI|nr:hypothetical protein [Alkalibacillus salilacus]